MYNIMCGIKQTINHQAFSSFAISITSVHLYVFTVLYILKLQSNLQFNVIFINNNNIMYV